MITITKEQLIEDLKASTQNASGMFEISEDTICALMSILTSAAPQLPQPAVVSDEMIDTFEAEFRRAFEVSPEVEQMLEIGYQGEKFSFSIRDAATWWKLGRAAILQAGNHTEQHLDMVNSPVIPDGLAAAAPSGIQMIPDGYVMVPKEPTAKMYDAGDQQMATKQVWDAMLAAAPQPQNSPQNIPEIIPGWIPVSERMPEVGDIVLTAMGGSVNVGEMERSGANHRYFTSVISGRELPATHWQPLPAAPKEVE